MCHVSVLISHSAFWVATMIDIDIWNDMWCCGVFLRGVGLCTEMLTQGCIFLALSNTTALALGGMGSHSLIRKEMRSHSRHNQLDVSLVGNVADMSGT